LHCGFEEEGRNELGSASEAVSIPTRLPVDAAAERCVLIGCSVGTLFGGDAVVE
jgi:hypothetical protein